MKTIELAIKYAGAQMAVSILPEENCNGIIYPVEVDGNYMFTFLEDEEGDWSIMKEANAVIPFVDEELYDAILKKLHYELLYAA